MRIASFGNQCVNTFAQHKRLIAKWNDDLHQRLAHNRTPNAKKMRPIGGQNLALDTTTVQSL